VYTRLLSSVWKFLEAYYFYVSTKEMINFYMKITHHISTDFTHKFRTSKAKTSCKCLL